MASCLSRRFSRRFRTAGFVTTAAALVATALVVPTLAEAAPHTPIAQPSIGSRIDNVQQRLGKLALKNDQLVERFNQANIAYDKTKRAAAAADTAYRLAQARLIHARDLLSASAAAQYEGGAFSATGALLESDSGSSYLSQLQTSTMLSQHNAQIVSSYTAIQQQASAAKRKADKLYAQAKVERAQVAQQRVVTSKQIDKYKKLLSSLNAEQRALWAARNSANAVVSRTQAMQLPRASNLHISGAVSTAIHFALAQVGKPYVWGAAGPDAYDCSGLTMAAYAAAGISLPHSAADQYNYGTHVSFDQMQPGDLMFFYSPIGHVTMYIGDGMMVSAPETGENVKVIPADTFGSDFVGATRIVN